MMMTLMILPLMILKHLVTNDVFFFHIIIPQGSVSHTPDRPVSGK